MTSSISGLDQSKKGRKPSAEVTVAAPATSSAKTVPALGWVVTGRIGR